MIAKMQACCLQTSRIPSVSPRARWVYLQRQRTASTLLPLNPSHLLLLSILEQRQMLHPSPHPRLEEGERMCLVVSCRGISAVTLSGAVAALEGLLPRRVRSAAPFHEVRLIKGRSGLPCILIPYSPPQRCTPCI